MSFSSNTFLLRELLMMLILLLFLERHSKWILSLIYLYQVFLFIQRPYEGSFPLEVLCHNWWILIIFRRFPLLFFSMNLLNPRSFIWFIIAALFNSHIYSIYTKGCPLFWLIPSLSLIFPEKIKIIDLCIHYYFKKVNEVISMRKKLGLE